MVHCMCRVSALFQQGSHAHAAGGVQGDHTAFSGFKRMQQPLQHQDAFRAVTLAESKSAAERIDLFGRNA